MAFTVQSVLNRSAVFLNDSALSIFTYAAQLPYFNQALDDLQEIFEENNIPSTSIVSAALTVPIGTTTIAFTGGPPTLPSNLIDIQWVGERLSGSTDDYIEMTRMEFEPSLPVVNDLIFYAWRDQKIVTLGALTARQILIRYVASLFAEVTSTTESITIINTKSFLAYRTAALCAEFIGENPERAEGLNVNAILALQRSMNIAVKGKQSIVTRRRPFMAGYRNSRIIT